MPDGLTLSNASRSSLTRSSTRRFGVGCRAIPMSETELAKEVLELVKAASETVKTLTSKEDKGQHEGQAARGGPLQIVGRLLIALATILALASSASAYFDHAGTVTWTTHALRALLFLVAFFSAAGGIWLVVFLASRHPSLLSSPTEYAASVHTELMGKGEQEGTRKEKTGGQERKPTVASPGVVKVAGAAAEGAPAAAENAPATPRSVSNRSSGAKKRYFIAASVVVFVVALGSVVYLIWGRR